MSKLLALIYFVITRLRLVINNLATARPDLPKPGLSTIPEEVLCLFFENLDECASACLGLTCKKMYRIHRTFHPTLVDVHSFSLFLVFDSSSKVQFSKCLHELIEGWVGTKYRWSECFDTFLNKGAFGDADAAEECGRLIRRRRT